MTNAPVTTIILYLTLGTTLILFFVNGFLIKKIKKKFVILEKKFQHLDEKYNSEIRKYKSVADKKLLETEIEETSRIKKQKSLQRESGVLNAISLEKTSRPETERPISSDSSVTTPVVSVQPPKIEKGEGAVKSASTARLQDKKNDLSLSPEDIASVETFDQFKIISIYDPVKKTVDFQKFPDTIFSLIRNNFKHIAVDFSDVLFLYSEELTKVVQSNNLIIQNQGYLCFFNVSQELKMLFGSAHLDTVLNLFRSREEFESHIKQGNPA